MMKNKEITGDTKMNNLVFTFLFLIVISFTSAFSGSGTGTLADPFQITNCTQLQEMNASLTANFSLINDINCSNTSVADASIWGVSGFSPIGNNTAGYSFTGSLNGNSKIISGLFINRTSTDYVGLFGVLGTGGFVNRTGLVNIILNGSSYVGGLAGSSTGNVNESYITGTVQGVTYVGGVFGIFSTGKVYRCFSNATVKGSSSLGGFVGSISGGVINDSYAMGNVSNGGYQGGFAGINTGTLGNVYSIGNITGANAGGLVGSPASGTTISSYWDMNTSGKATSTSGTGLTTIQMKNVSSFTGWNFTNVWGISSSFNNGYPYLTWQVQQADTTSFISAWNTSKAGSAATTIILPLESTGTYNFTAYWGDGNSSIITTYNSANVTHVYSSAGVYNVTINGTIIKGFRFAGAGDMLKIINIIQWGNLNLGNSNGYFQGCANLNATATDSPNLTGTTTMYNAFKGATVFNGNISNWDMSNITTTAGMFYGATSFNQPIGNWNTSKVTLMSASQNGMFDGATSFNQNLTGWDVSKVTNMGANYGGMFNGATAFNGNISNWDVSNVTDMAGMFNGATAFNQSLANWNTSKVTTMWNMFLTATSFNQDIGSWNTSNVRDMTSMFQNAAAFNQNLSNWDTSKVATMSTMFRGATAFNGNISNWNTANVTTMGQMFYNAGVFNQPLNNWNTSKVNAMNGMFVSAGAFNQDVGNWDTSNVTDMAYMFYQATSFNQNLGRWNVSKVTTMSNMLTSVTLSTPNYDSLLIGWASLSTLVNNTPLTAGSSKYCVGRTARNTTLIGAYNWSITDGGLNASCDLINPSITPTYFDNNTFYGNGTINFTASISDNVGIKNATLNVTDLSGNNWGVFNGVDNYVNLGTPAQLQLNTSVVNITYSFWIKDSVRGERNIFRSFYNPRISTILSSSNDSIYITILSGATTTATLVSPTRFLDDSWHSVLLTMVYYNSTYTNASLYIDGSFKSSGYVTHYASLWANTLGEAAGAAGYYNGSMDEVRIYNRSLSASEISAIYSSGLKRNTSINNTGLVTWYDFESPSNSTLLVDKANGLNNGTITGMTYSNSYSSTASYVAGTLTATVGIVVNLIDSVYSWFWNIFDYGENSVTTTNKTLTIDSIFPNFNFFAPLNNSFFNYMNILFNVPSSASPNASIVPNLDNSLVSWWRMEDPGIGTGGDVVTSDGAYTVHKFTTNGTFVPPVGV
ncbi:MAG: BspA family leucine-rich repeat surface protein, partial [archaeon]